MPISEKQQKWIISHFKNTKNDVIIQKMNISHSSLHRFARENGLKKTKQFQTKCQLNAAAKANQVNRANNWPPKGYIIPKSEDNRFKAGVKPIERLGKIKNRKRIDNSAQSRRKTVAAEKRRVLFGLPQKTKLKVVASTHRKICFRHILKKRGYITQRGSLYIFYSENTNRSLKSETTATKQYNFRILQLTTNNNHQTNIQHEPIFCKSNTGSLDAQKQTTGRSQAISTQLRTAANTRY